MLFLTKATSEFAVVTAVTNSSHFTATQNDASSMTTGSTINITRLKRSAFEEPSRNMMGVVGGSAGTKTLSGTNTRFQLQLHLEILLLLTMVQVILEGELLKFHLILLHLWMKHLL